MNEVSINLNKVISQLLPQTIEQGLDMCGYIVENEAKKNCPVDTGILRASINHSVNKEVCTIGTNVEYAAAVHERHKTKPKFLQNAADSKMNELPRVFEKLLEKQVIK